MRDPLRAVVLAGPLVASLALAAPVMGTVVFFDGFESGSPCAWQSEGSVSCPIPECWEPGVGLRPVVGAQPGDLLLNEWLPDPTAVVDQLGEWFEVRALSAVDLNGLQAFGAQLAVALVVPEEGDCLPLTPSDPPALFARSPDPVANGGLPPVDGTFSFGLLNANGSLGIARRGAGLDARSWAAAPSGRSIMVDSLGVECVAPPGVPSYNGVDFGTPAAHNGPPDCSPLPGTCVDPVTLENRPVVSPEIGDLAISEWMPDPAEVADSVGEWFELRALASFDLNGLQAGTTTLQWQILPTGGACVPVQDGDLVLFARSADSGLNGSLPPVDGTFSFTLVNAGGSLQIGFDDVVFNHRIWTSSLVGRSIVIDANGDQCNAPVGTPLYNSIDVGTPRATNQPNSC